MRISEQWIREFADPKVDTAALAHGLTMAGLKVDAIEPASDKLEGVIAARVLSCEQHPDADKLTVCDVDSGKGKHRIVCGADNVRVGMIAPLALPGAKLPGGVTITATELRGVRSEGMLCSGRELGLSDDHAGLLDLDENTKPGTPMAELFGASDNILELDLTPNRGDCFSVLGVAREVAAIYALPAPVVPLLQVDVHCDASRPVNIENANDCAIYLGRVVKGVDGQRQSPMWLREKLRRAGIRPIGLAVDITALVMLELGQPMHAFDNDKLNGNIQVRRGKPGEKLVLLDGQEVSVDNEILVVADEHGPVALAGIMGGDASAVDEGTRDVFLESAHFTPLAVVGRARRFGVHTDASQRFERGVDPTLPAQAMEYATKLLIDLGGGEAGPVSSAGTAPQEVREPAIHLRRERITRVLGTAIGDEFIEATLGRLRMSISAAKEGWQVSAPAARFDIEIEEDLIEEIARFHGYDRIPTRDGLAPMVLHPVADAEVPESRIVDALIQRGYQQVVTYSFVDPELQAQLGLNTGAVDLANPISADLAQMRTSLWPGLIKTLDYNANRQQVRVRIFESGLTFVMQDDVLKQEKMLAGLVWGDRHSVQWGLPQGSVDFYDLKADCEALLALGGGPAPCFRAAEHPSLHPGQSAEIQVEGRRIGWIGSLHPAITQKLGLAKTPYLFEIAMGYLQVGVSPKAAPISRFPALRRDLALVVPEGLTVGALLAEVDAKAPEWLASRFIFDIYRGKGVEPGLKSIALGLILQETSRTLTDDEVDDFVQGLVEHLGRSVQATLRE